MAEVHGTPLSLFAVTILIADDTVKEKTGRKQKKGRKSIIEEAEWKKTEFIERNKYFFFFFCNEEWNNKRNTELNVKVRKRRIEREK